MPKKKSAKDEPNFEDAMTQLETIVRRLEQGGGALEEAIEDYSNAIGLIKVCHVKLDSAQRKIEILSGADAEGNPISEAVDESELELEEQGETTGARRSAGRRSSKKAKNSMSSKSKSELF